MQKRNPTLPLCLLFLLPFFRYLIIQQRKATSHNQSTSIALNTAVKEYIIQ